MAAMEGVMQDQSQLQNQQQQQMVVPERLNHAVQQQLNLESVKTRAISLFKALTRILEDFDAYARTNTTPKWQDILGQYSMVNLELFSIVDEIKKVSKAFVVHPKNVNAENATILPVMLSSKLLPEMEMDDNSKREHLLQGMQSLPISSQIEKLKARIDMIAAACEGAEKVLADTRKAYQFGTRQGPTTLPTLDKAQAAKILEQENLLRAAVNGGEGLRVTGDQRQMTSALPVHLVDVLAVSDGMHSFSDSSGMYMKNTPPISNSINNQGSLLQPTGTPLHGRSAASPSAATSATSFDHTTPSPLPYANSPRSGTNMMNTPSPQQQVQQQQQQQQRQKILLAQQQLRQSSLQALGQNQMSQMHDLQSQGQQKFQPLHGQHQMQYSQPVGHQQFQSRQLSSGHVQHGMGQSQLNQGNQLNRHLSQFSSAANTSLFNTGQGAPNTQMIPNMSSTMSSQPPVTRMQFGLAGNNPQRSLASTVLNDQMYNMGVSNPGGMMPMQQQQQQQQQQVVEEASPISSRPPATAATTSGGGVMNLDEFMRLSGGGGGAEEDIAGEDADRTGGIASGNRWPRQETLALLQIRSEMDAAFRDATLKGPLWEDVSRKLAEMGYKRSAKKCKEKFENVHKYYKRTKEGRAGRQDGKSYRFFSQLEALQNTGGGGGVSSSISNVSGVAPQLIGTATTSSLDVAPVSVGIPMPIRTPPPSSQVPQPASNIGSMFPPDLGATVARAAAAGAPVRISFSSNESSSSQSSEDDDDDEDEGILGGQTSAMGAGTSRKRKRASLSSSKGETHRMMEFFEGLMKQVMQKQEAMQHRFLEAIEKREQDRMIRDEAWKRQEVARLSREHEIMAQERSISASRDAAIVAFLQKITGQTIHLPTPVSIAPLVSQPQPPPPTQPQQVQIASLVTVSTQPPLQPQPMPLSQVTPQQNKQLPQQQHHQQQQHQQVHHQHQPPSISSEIVMAVPEQQIAPLELGSGGSEPASSRWPKPEVLALIKLRSGLETRYQEAGPKGPLWEEISAGMLRLGYKRSSKRCKEKWENINKYFKKVKESNKKRTEDAKTCPYFHELDALYRKKILGSSSGGAGSTSTSGFDSQINRPQKQQHQHQESLELDPMPPPMQQTVPQQTQATESQNKNGASVDVQASNTVLAGSPFGEGNGGAEKKPEDIVKELMKQQGTQQQQQLMVDDYDKMEEGDSENVNEDEYDEEDDGDEDEEEDEALQEERKMAYKIEFQRQNTSNATNGGGSGAPSFLAMVQ